jgi:transcriptional antiterminator RfaH
MFVRLEEGIDDFSRLRSTKGCVDLVKFGGKASYVPIEFIELIQGQANKDCIIDFAVLDKVEVGGSVRVADGPFAGLFGKIASHKSNERVIVLLHVLGGERGVELSRDQVDKV